MYEGMDEQVFARRAYIYIYIYIQRTGVRKMRVYTYIYTHICIHTHTHTHTHTQIIHRFASDVFTETILRFAETIRSNFARRQTAGMQACRTKPLQN
jgi:hypothetical protein